MKLQLQLVLFCLLSLTIITVSCKKENITPTDSFQAVVDAGGGFSSPNESYEVLDTETYTEENDTAVWLCTTETVSIQDGAGGKDGFPLFSPNASVIYPGSMLQGNSLNEATPAIIAVDRAGGVISTDVADGNIQSFFEVDEVSKSAVGNAINNIIANSTGIIPANFSFKYQNIQSKEQFALAAGVSVDGAFGDLDASLSFSTDKEYNRYFVSLNQSYYTMSFDVPNNLDDLFAPDVRPEDLAKYVAPDNPAAYISDVTYGRIYYMLIESTSTVTEMDAAIAGSFNGVTTDVDGYVEVDYFQDLKDLKITVYAYGGETTGTLQTVGVGLGNLSPLIDLLAETTVIESGKPISYVVRSVYDNQIVSTQLATQYDVTNCQLSGLGSPPPYTAHWTGNVASAFGPVGAAYCDEDDSIVLINKDGDKFMRSAPGELEGPYSIDLLGSEACPLDGIGATSYMRGSSTPIMAFDLDGINYSYMSTAGSWSPKQPITNLAGGTCPFNLFGVGAHLSASIVNDWEVRILADSDGKLFTYYTEEPDPEFSSTFGFDHPLMNGADLPFDAIGACAVFPLGDDYFQIFFNTLGTKYIIRGDFLDNDEITVLGPFDL